MDVNKWPLETFGRVRVMIYLLEQTGFYRNGWEAKEYNYSQMPLVYEKYLLDSDYPLNMILEKVSRKIVKARLTPYLIHMIKVIKSKQDQLLTLDLSESDRRNIENEITMLADRLGYINECMKKLRSN